MVARAPFFHLKHFQDEIKYSNGDNARVVNHNIDCSVFKQLYGTKFCFLYRNSFSIERQDLSKFFNYVA